MPPEEASSTTVSTTGAEDITAIDLVYFKYLFDGAMLSSFRAQ